ncbi:MAG: hypothetical protein H7A53_05855 [Akkermansiaceae bacterium]|nr:hypothetical protein [Akkermansiaceae bacterium]
MEDALRGALRDHFGARSIVLKPGVGQGNHLTWQAEVDDLSLFLRVENGPEEDDHLAVESALLDRVQRSGVPTPRVFNLRCHASRVPACLAGAGQLTDGSEPLAKAGATPESPGGISDWSGRGAVAGIEPKGFQSSGGWKVAGRSYADYFFLRLKEHLDFLKGGGFSIPPDGRRSRL